MQLPSVLLAVLTACAPGADVNLEVKKSPAPRPAPQAVVQRELPRLLFLAQVVQRNKLFGPEAKTTYFIHDPSDPEAGFRKVFEAPGEEQYCRFLTPLFGGVGLAMGQVDPDRRESPRRLFWFDLLAGKPGETVAIEPWDERLSGSEAWFRTKGALNRLDVLVGTLSTFPIQLSQEVRIGEKLLLGATTLEGILHAVRVDLQEEKLVDFGELPTVFQRRGDRVQVQPAGPQARDGLFLVGGSFDGFDLWYTPPETRWLRVIRGIHVLKLTGGTSPWLPVTYLGDRRFAVARTVTDGGPPPEPQQGPDAPAVCSTLLIDGMTGRILEETTPRAYEYMPELDFPESWWSEEARAARKRNSERPPPAALVTWVEASRVFRFRDGKTLSPGNGEETRLSPDGRRLAIYRRWAPEGDPPARIRFRMLDGESGAEETLEISLPAREAFVNAASWQVLCGPSPTAEDLAMQVPARRAGSLVRSLVRPDRLPALHHTGLPDRSLPHAPRAERDGVTLPRHRCSRGGLSL